MVVNQSLIVYLAKSLFRRQNHRKGIANTKTLFLLITLTQKNLILVKQNQTVVAIP